MATSASKKRTGSPRTSGSRGNRTPLHPTLLISLAVVAILAIIAGCTTTTSPPVTGAVPIGECSNRTLAYVNELLSSQGTVASLVSATESNGMYTVIVSHQGGKIPLSVTRDCTLLFTEGMEMGSPLSNPTAGACSDRVLTFVNDYFVNPNTSASVAGVKEQHGMYQVNVSYQGREIPLYASPDCTLLFNEGLDITAPPPTPTPTPEPVKTDRPTVDLYVMSFCPYGTQAEATLKPVVALLGEKADFRIRYITTVTGTTLSSIQSLHGEVEAEEDLRQTCIQKDAPGDFWTYLTRFNAECYPLGRNQTGVADCSRNITASLGIDQGKLTACMTGTEGIELLKTDEMASDQNQATASPTLIVNGVVFEGERTPEAYKQAVCGSFTNSPAECATVLSSQAASATGSC